MVSIRTTRNFGERQAGAMKELLRSLENHVAENLERYFRDPGKIWQPADFSPDFSTENLELQHRRVLARTVGIEELIVLVGDTITEDALPTYSAWLRVIVDDPSGTSDNPLAVASRRWSAEERRHGVLLNYHLLLDPRINHRMVEKTIHYLIARGFKTKALNPVEGFVYTSFQERATWISHSNLGKMVTANNYLRDTSDAVAKDEKRHEEYYKTVLMKKIFELFPETAITAFANMLQDRIDMPAINMQDGEENHTKETLFDRFSMVAQKIRVYTAQDYVNILKHLSEHWGVKDLVVSGPDAQSAKEFILELPERIQRVADRKAETSPKYETPKFGWINYNIT